jgi:competence protein ComEA
MQMQKKERFLLLVLLVGVLLAGSVYLYGGKPQPSAVSAQDGQKTVAVNTPRAAQNVEGSIKVHVKGEVNHPGVYQLPADSRVSDGIDAAGGANPSGEVNKLNLAAQLKDGQELVVPSNKAVDEAKKTEAGSGKLNLNAATAEELDKLPGIGSTRAQAIVEYRETQGRFLEIDDLKKVPGFGQKLVDQIREKVMVQ